MCASHSSSHEPLTILVTNLHGPVHDLEVKYFQGGSKSRRHEHIIKGMFININVDKH